VKIASPERFQINALGIAISTIALSDLLELISAYCQGKSRAVALGHNLHSTYLYQTNNDFRRLYDLAEVVLVDGFPVLLSARHQAAQSGVDFLGKRIGSTDWIPRIGDSGINSLFVVGGSYQTNERALDKLRGILGPKTMIEGFPGENWTHHLEGEFQNRVSELSPDLVLVGLGMPLQEGVILRLLGSRAQFGLVAAVGGALDQIAGTQSNAPRWLGKMGLEWLWRFATQPKRLFHRYWVEPFKLLSILLLRKRTSPLENKNSDG